MPPVHFKRTQRSVHKKKLDTLWSAERSAQLELRSLVRRVTKYRTTLCIKHGQREANHFVAGQINIYTAGARGCLWFSFVFI